MPDSAAVTIRVVWEYALLDRQWVQLPCDFSMKRIDYRVLVRSGRVRFYTIVLWSAFDTVASILSAAAMQMIEQATDPVKRYQVKRDLDAVIETGNVDTQQFLRQRIIHTRGSLA